METAKTPEQTAWDLVLEYELLVLWNIRRFLKAPRAAFTFDDLKTAAYVSAYRAALSWDPSKAKFSTYLSSCVYNGLYDESRRLQVGYRTRRGVFYATSYDPAGLEDMDPRNEEFEDQVVDTILADRSQDSLLAALEGLSDLQRELIHLRYNERRSFTQIARHYGISKQAAEQRHTTIKKQLKGLLEEEGYVRSK